MARIYVVYRVYGQAKDSLKQKFTTLSAEEAAYSMKKKNLARSQDFWTGSV